VERPPAEKFEDLIVWQKSHALVLRVYKLTKTYPKDELFGLTSQMRRAAVSVPANIAEGFSKKGKPDKARILNIAQASLEELRYYFMLSRDLGYVPPSTEWNDLSEVGRILGAYIRGVLGRTNS
jgi:four helix bundle protein